MTEVFTDNEDKALAPVEEKTTPSLSLVVTLSNPSVPCSFSLFLSLMPATFDETEAITTSSPTSSSSSSSMLTSVKRIDVVKMFTYFALNFTRNIRRYFLPI